MTYTVFIYEGGNPVSSKPFSSIQDAFRYLGELDLTTNVKRCILDNGDEILFDLTRDSNGDLSTTKK